MGFAPRSVFFASAAIVGFASGLEAGPLKSWRERREARHEATATELVLTKDGKPAVKFPDGSVSQIQQTKGGELFAPKGEAKKTIRLGGQPVQVVPAK